MCVCDVCVVHVCACVCVCVCVTVTVFTIRSPQSVIVSQLCKRYKKRLVYTYVGDILISINPFQKLDIYSEKVRRYD